MLSLGITLYFDIARQSQSIDSTISSTAAYVASMDGVAEMLANGYPTQEVTGSLDSLHQNFPGIDIIAVYDRNGLRFYHTSRLETGETFVAGEETAILSGSPPYITTGYGTHGNQRVAFHAVRDGSGSIIGFVTVAIFRADILQRSLNLVLLFSLVLGGMFGVALLLARGIVHLLKGSLRGHHPKELLDLYLQQDDLLNSIEDGLVATDLRGQVVFANDQARTLLQCGSTPLEGQPLTRFFPETGCIQVARSGQAVHNRSCVIQERQILASEVPILGENGSQGVLNVFHDKTEMRKLSDESLRRPLHAGHPALFQPRVHEQAPHHPGLSPDRREPESCPVHHEHQSGHQPVHPGDGGLYPGVPPVRPHHREDDARRRAGHPAHRNPRQLLPGGGPAPLPGGLCHHPGQPVGKRHRRAQPKPQRGAGDQAVHVLPP